jgi:hypothetical protein
MTDHPVLALARALNDAHELVQTELDGVGPLEDDRALQFVLAAYDLATEMWFQKGDPAAPRLTNWERPWRKYGGDNPTTSYLSAPVAAGRTYRLRGDVADAVYAGVQVYTKGPGYNAPSANISDTDLVDADGHIDLTIGGERPAGGGAWLPLVDDDYLVMVRLYHRRPELHTPPFSIERTDGAPMAPLSTADRATATVAYFREEILSTIAVTQTLRTAGVNAYPAPDAPVMRPQYTGALFPTLDNVYDGFYVDLQPGQALRLRGVPPVARYSSFVFYDHWFNTPDFDVHRCYLTLDDLELDSDGTYEVILGPDDPGHPNWIDTAGLRRGIFSVRCLLPEQRHLPGVELIDVPGTNGSTS